MIQVSIQDLKPQLSSLIGDAEAGATIVITRHGRPVACLVPADPPYVRRGRDVGPTWPRAITSGLGSRAVAMLHEDRGDH